MYDPAAGGRQLVAVLLVRTGENKNLTE